MYPGALKACKTQTQLHTGLTYYIVVPELYYLYLQKSRTQRGVREVSFATTTVSFDRDSG